MRKVFLYVFFFLFLGVLTGCEVIEYHPYDARVTGDYNINAVNMARITFNTLGKRSLRVAMISDTQRSYDELENAIRAINYRGDVDFVIHGGDQADFGETKEFIWTRDWMNRLTRPYVCLLGNHDCLGTGFHVFEKIYGEDNFAFTAGNVRFVCLNTNALEFDYSEPVPDFTFLEQEVERGTKDGVEKTVVVMHAPPGDLVFNNNVEKTFQRYIEMLPNVLFCLYGHNHHFQKADFWETGLMFYGCTTVAERGYYLITINDEGYAVEECAF